MFILETNEWVRQYMGKKEEESVQDRTVCNDIIRYRCVNEPVSWIFSACRVLSA